MPAGVRPFLRVVIVALLGAAALVALAADALAPWRPWGSFGFDASFDGRITNVYAGMPAARAGLHYGDRVDLRATHLDALRSLTPFALAWPGTSSVFAIRQANGTDRFVRLTAVPWPRTTLDNITDMITVVCLSAFVLISAWLVLVRPSLLTWSFFVFATNTGYVSGLLQELLSPAALMIANAVLGASVIVGAVAFAAFALLFPRLAPNRAQSRILMALGAIAFPLVVAELSTAPMALTNYAGTISAQSVIATIGNIFAISMYLIAIGFFVFNYLRAPATDHPRMRWVIGGFIVAFVGNLFVFVTQNTPAIALTPPVWAINLLAALAIFAPISVAYAILKHHVIDVRFFLSRALVYGLLTTLAIALLALLEWAVARQLELTNLGIYVELAGAVLVGLGIHRAHGVIDAFVDRFVFRSIHDAERHFTSIGRAMMYAQSTRSIDDLVAQESARALHLSAVAVYHAAEPGAFLRTYSTGAPLPDAFDRDSRVVLHLLADRTPIERDGRLAVPFTAHDRLLGFALFGAHTNATAIDPNERQLLESLCTHAAAGYDHVASEARVEENLRLRTELTLLQAKYDEAHSLVNRIV